MILKCGELQISGAKLNESNLPSPRAAHRTFVTVHSKSIAFPHGATAHSGLGLQDHSDTPQSIVLLWVSDQLVAATSTWQYNNHWREISMPLAGFEPATPVSERQQPSGWPCRNYGGYKTAEHWPEKGSDFGQISLSRVSEYCWLLTARGKGWWYYQAGLSLIQ